ncbi:MAG: DUF5320 domain-containing protein [bacterium]
MPGFDGTGPRGQGSMTGRGFGFCVLPRLRSPQGRTISRLFRPRLGMALRRGRRGRLW